MRLQLPGAGGGRKKLSEGVRILLNNPEVAFRSCDDCAKFCYNDDGSMVTRRNREGLELPVLRPALVPTPCHKCPKIPYGSRAKDRSRAVDLSERNLKAWQHYTRCRATGRFPRDPLVAANAAVIRAAYDGFERAVIVRRLDVIRILLTRA